MSDNSCVPNTGILRGIYQCALMWTCKQKHLQYQPLSGLCPTENSTPNINFDEYSERKGITMSHHPIKQFLLHCTLGAFCWFGISALQWFYQPLILISYPMQGHLPNEYGKPFYPRPRNTKDVIKILPDASLFSAQHKRIGLASLSSQTLFN